MGMFDTIIFEKPITCKCGHKIESSQTKAFDVVMETYRVGDLVSATPILSFEVLCETRKAIKGTVSSYAYRFYEKISRFL